MAQKKCNYIFVNTTKKHKKGDTCNNPIRLKNKDVCWYHTSIDKPLEDKKELIKELNDSTNEIIEVKPSEVTNTLKSSSFIQLENS